MIGAYFGWQCPLATDPESPGGLECMAVIGARNADDLERAVELHEYEVHDIVPVNNVLSLPPRSPRD